MLKFKVITPNTTQVLALADVKAHLKVENTADDALITAIMSAVRKHTEEYLGRFLLTTVLDQFYNDFGHGCLTLFYTPVTALTSVKYFNANNQEQTLPTDDYLLDNSVEPSLMKVAFGKTAPAVRYFDNSVTIRYSAGYSNPAAVPDPIKLAMMLMITRYYEHRDDTVYRMPTAAQNLLTPYRITWHW